MKTIRYIILAGFVIIFAIVLANKYKNILYNAMDENDQLVNPKAVSKIDQNKPEIKSIVSLAPNLTEILFELGLGEKVIAVTDDSNFPLEASRKQKIGTFWQPDIEKIIACKPDLVITLWFEQQKTIADSLKRLGYNVLTLRIEKISQLLSAIEQIGLDTGSSVKAKTLKDGIERQIEDLKDVLKNTSKVKTLWVIQPQPLTVAGKNTFIDEIIELTGGENIVTSTIQQYPQIDSEQILTSNAEVIIHSAMSTEDIEKQQQSAIQYWSKYPDLPAVKNNRIYVLDSDILLRLGPRLTQGLKTVARCLHPKLFQEDSDG